MIRPLVSGAALAGVLGCFQPSPSTPREGAAATLRAARATVGPHPLARPSSVGTIRLLEIVLPEAGSSIGGVYAGSAFERRVGDVRMGDGARRRLSRAARHEGDSLLRREGYVVRAPAPPSSDAEPLEDVRFAISGQVADLVVKVAGEVAPVRVDAMVDVSWELIDVSAGRPIFGIHTNGAVRQADSVDVALLLAVDSAFRSLLANDAFRHALATPRPMLDEALYGFSWPRPAASPRDTIRLTREDRNPSVETDPLGRLAAGLVFLRVEHGRTATGSVITRDGLVLTANTVASQARPIWARFPNGVERPVRVLRQHGGVALLQVSCPDPCQTVDLDPGGWPGPADSIFTLGAPSRVGAAWPLTRGLVSGECGLFGGAMRYLDISGEVASGDAIARPSDGRVFAIGLVRGHANCAVSLHDVFRGLRIAGSAVESAGRPSP